MNNIEQSILPSIIRVSCNWEQTPWPLAWRFSMSLNGKCGIGVLLGPSPYRDHVCIYEYTSSSHDMVSNILCSCEVWYHQATNPLILVCVTWYLHLTWGWETPFVQPDLHLSQQMINITPRPAASIRQFRTGNAHLSFSQNLALSHPTPKQKWAKNTSNSTNSSSWIC